MSLAAVGKALRIRIDFPARTIGGMLLDQQLRPMAEPLFAVPARVEGDRMVWVVELPDGVGIGTVIAGSDIMLRAENGKVAIVLPTFVAATVAGRLRAAGVVVETRREAAGTAVILGIGRRVEVGMPVVGAIGLGGAA